jgi:hypothetical protein
MVSAGEECRYGHRCHFRHALKEDEWRQEILTKFIFFTLADCNFRGIRLHLWYLWHKSREETKCSAFSFNYATFNMDWTKEEYGKTFIFRYMQRWTLFERRLKTHRSIGSWYDAKRSVTLYFMCICYCTKSCFVNLRLKPSCKR